MKANLTRIKGLPKTVLLEPPVDAMKKKLPEINFDSHKKIIFVDSKTKLDEFLSVLSLSEPRWVGVDVEHTKTEAYHGLICLI